MIIPGPIKVLLIDHAEIQLAGLRHLLSDENHISITGTFGSVKDAQESDALKQSDVVLFDCDFDTNRDFNSSFQLLRTLNPQLKIIVWSYLKDINHIIHSIQAGASAYLTKDTTAEELKQTIHLAMSGKGFFLGETIPKSVLESCFKSPAEAMHANAKPWHLTEREIEIIKLLTEGLIAKEIAERLKINITTVESHKENIKQKLNCKTVVGIVAFALKNGLVS